MAAKAVSLKPEDDLRLLEDRFSFFKADLNLEKLQRSQHWVMGLDEVGRGCVAGPVTASAFAYRLTEEQLLWQPPYRVIDSKKLSATQRNQVLSYFKAEPHFFSATAECTVEEIDRLNILQASLLALRKSAKACLEMIPESAFVWVLVDGNQMPKLEGLREADRMQATCVVKGDSKSFAIAAASICAKEKRDGFMKKIAADFHQDFGWESNVGYPTPAHKEAIQKHGPTEWHRRSFRL